MKTNWQTKKLSEICDKASSNISQNQLANEVGNYPIYGAGGFIKNVSFYHRDKEYIAIIKDGAGIGRLFLLPAYSSVIGTLQYVLPREDIDIKFLCYFLNSVDFLKHKNGSTIPHIYFKDYANEPILVPPLAEQKRIVKILDEVFEGIEKAKENAERNLKNSQELFESYLQGVFANPGKDWEEKRLGDACDFVQGVQIDAKLQSETKKENQVRFLRIIDFTQGGELPRYVDNPGEKYIINTNDISLVRYGASTGFVCRGLEGVLANNLFRVIPKNIKEISNDYLFIFLKSPVFKKIIKKSLSGTAMPAISFGLIRDIPILIIPLADQKAIVKKLDALSGETKKLEAIFRRKIADLDELKKSVLKQAFSGEL